ncbi:hypothetical protein ATCC90586_005512 [Pythium insidiosum]|nr:hypothetical protein ATCC90586_005512 [Pythium insidiosum]
MRATSSSIIAATLLAAVIALTACVCEARLVWTSLELAVRVPEERSKPSTPAVHARELVHLNEWGTLATTSKAFDGIPYGNIVSFSDGIGLAPQNSTGEIFFYLTKWDSVVPDLAASPRATLSISQIQEGASACNGMDVEDPTCMKITIIGRVAPVSKDKEAFALKALFSRHPQMAAWPEGHGFQAYQMNIETMVLFDYYGGAKHISPEEYYRVKLA